MLMLLLAAAPPYLFKLATPFLRLSAMLALAVSFLSQVFLGSVDTLATVAVVIRRPCESGTASQRQYSLCGNE
jgi:hypothetical protein